MSNSISQLIPRDTEHLRVVLNALSANKRVRAVGAVLLGAAVLRKACDLFAQAALNNFTRDTYDWRSEIVVVTGGSGGLGDLLVRKLAKESIKVISLDIMPPKTPLPAKAYYYKTDITSSESIDQTAAAIRKDHGHPTVLVNNAGAMWPKALLDESQDEVRRTFAINIISNFDLVRAFLPAMVERDHGHVIHTASMASFITPARLTSYSAAKAAVLSLHEGLAQELANLYKAKRVRTSIIHPTFMRTPMLDFLVEAKGADMKLLDPEQVVDGIFKQILSGQSGQVFFPSGLSFLSGVKGWPAWLQSALRRTQRDSFYVGKGW